MNQVLSKLKEFTKNSDLAIAIFLLIVLAVMIVPIHPTILDLFLSFTLSISVIVLLMSIYSKRPLDFSTFPSILLVTTLFRLSLNIASTRNILLRGGTEGTAAAGNIIQAFGEFVVEGNYVVGLIIFTILVVINFLVITKGAGRVSEVAARFTLDAMPGKQMAIDADLNAGLINEEEAKKRRSEIAEEADFYGSMDGASKFVRGDAIAGIVITVINIIAGIIVGVFQNNMDISSAAETFTLLTVGDGLISQIPAIIISTAAGIIATRNSNHQALGAQISHQFKVHPKAIYMSAGVLFLLSLIPGLPQLPFVMIGIFLCYVAYKLENQMEKEKLEEKIKKEQNEDDPSDSLEDLLGVEILELEIGYGLVDLVDAEQKGDLLERITQIRKQFVLDWGVIIPSIKVKDNLELPAGGYCFKVKGMEMAKGELMVDHHLAMDPGSVVEKIEGVETTEPVFGLPSVWVTEENKDEAQYNGYTVVDLATVMATHMTEILKNNLSELVGRQELSHLLDRLKEESPKVVKDLIPEILTFGVVLKVIQNLLQEKISIRDLRTILESLAEYGQNTKEAKFLTEYVRRSLARSITENLKSGEGDVPVFTLEPEIEEAISQGLIQTDYGEELSLGPELTQNILSRLHDRMGEAMDLGEKMIVLCSPSVRPHFKKMTEKFIPNLSVISHHELSSDVHIRSLGTVRL